MQMEIQSPIFDCISPSPGRLIQLLGPVGGAHHQHPLLPLAVGTVQLHQKLSLDSSARLVVRVGPGELQTCNKIKVTSSKKPPCREQGIDLVNEDHTWFVDFGHCKQRPHHLLAFPHPLGGQ